MTPGRPSRCMTGKCWKVSEANGERGFRGNAACFERVDNLERIAPVWRPVCSSHLVATTILDCHGDVSLAVLWLRTRRGRRREHLRRSIQRLHHPPVFFRVVQERVVITVGNLFWIGLVCYRAPSHDRCSSLHFRHVLLVQKNLGRSRFL